MYMTRSIMKIYCVRALTSVLILPFVSQPVLIRQLYDAKLLPGIIWNFERRFCDTLAFALSAKLEYVLFPNFKHKRARTHSHIICTLSHRHSTHRTHLN